jgi:hypothetical protein
VTEQELYTRVFRETEPVAVKRQVVERRHESRRAERIALALPAITSDVPTAWRYTVC